MAFDRPSAAGGSDLYSQLSQQRRQRAYGPSAPPEGYSSPYAINRSFAPDNQGPTMWMNQGASSPYASAGSVPPPMSASTAQAGGGGDPYRQLTQAMMFENQHPWWAQVRYNQNRRRFGL